MIVLFICTANVYRSRFAEAVFNHRAEGCGSPWRARSRGLDVQKAGTCTSISTKAGEALRARNVPFRHTSPAPNPLTRKDLEDASQVIVLDEAEHRSMMAEQFPDWVDCVTYWHIKDQIFGYVAEQALPEIERQVVALVEELST